MRVEVMFETENAAFGEFPEVEAARLLRRAADRVVVGLEFGATPLLDSNGNRVGFLVIS